MKPVVLAIGRWLTAAAILTLHSVSAEQQPATNKNVLVLHQELASRPFRSRFNAAFVDALRSGDAIPVDVYEEAIESERFPGPEQLHLIRDYLGKKYADRRIDVMVVVGMKALTFAREHREIFGNPPMVAVALPANRIDGGDDNVTGLQVGGWVNGTIDLALALRPDTESVVVVDGTRDSTGDLQSEIERQLQQRGRPLSLVYLRDLPLNELLPRVAAIPPRSVVLFVRQTIRDAAHDLDPFEGLSQVLAASPVPVFSQMEEFLGRGVVGGYMWRYEDDARRMARMAKSIAKGARARDLPREGTTYATLLDWRALRRWEIPESRLPAGSTVLFRRQTFFETYRPYVVSGLLVFGAQLTLIVGLLVQRVRRRRAEQALRTNEQRYRSVVDTQSELICRFLPDTTLTFVNDAYCRFWGKARHELIGHRFIELIPDADRAAVVERIGTLRSGTDSHEHPVTLRDGSVGWQHWINQVILDQHGGVAEMQGVGRDITDRKRAEQAISTLEARNSAILRAIPDLMFVLRSDGTYLDYHARDLSQLFAPPDRFIGKRITEVMPPALAELFMNALDRAYRGEDAVIVEYELSMSEPRQYEARLVHAGDDRVLTIVRDLTDSKRASEINRDLAGRLITSQEAERARIARELHDDVCQDVAALSVDLSHLRRRADRIGRGEVENALHALQDRAATVAESLRLLSHGLHSSVLHHMGLVPALQAHCAEVERQHEVAVNFFASGDVEPTSKLVALSLFRISQEALRNSALHGHARRASVSLTRTDSDLMLVIADDGQGFDVAAARRNGGLGLVSIEERARLVKGEVEIRSDAGRGTTVDIRVPVAMVDREQ